MRTELPTTVGVPVKIGTANSVQAYEMLQTQGAILGRSDATKAEWYVLDGDVWYASGGMAEMEEPSDYFEFMALVREGGRRHLVLA